MRETGGGTRRLSACGAILATIFVATSAAAQDPLGPPGGGLGPDPTALPRQPSKTDPEMPETHAASGAGTSTLPTEEAQLPEDPNAIPEELEDALGSDYDAEIEARAEETYRQFFGVYYGEESGDYSFRTVFPPLWMERKQGDDRASLFGLSYYNRRSKDVDADVLFPIFWHLRDQETYTTIVGPVMHREGPKGHDNWVAPLFFEGSGEHGSEYLHIPPLLTFHTRTDHDGFSMAGPLFCKWKGGARCDARTAEEIDYGIAPFYFYGRDDRSEYEVIPPLLHYYAYSEIGDQETDVWGPVWLERSRDGGVVNVLPIFWHNWNDTEDATNTTLFPFFHYGTRGPTQRTLATPLFVDHVDEEGAHTFATYLYARHRGRTELDMVTPLFWQYRDPDVDLTQTMVLPFVWRETSPRSDELAIFPFYGHFHRHGLKREWWITPLFRHQKSVTGWETDIFPIFYAGRENQSTHLVVAPILFDFNSPSSRSTVVFPLFWRFADRDGLVQVVGNTYYSEEKVEGGGTDWQFHFFPLFAYGESPDGHWWNVLYGLAGYTQRGTSSKMRMFYIPISLSE